IRDSLGEKFYDPFGTNWDNFNRDFAHLYDHCIVSRTYPGCNYACGHHNGVGWKMMVRRHIAVHNAKAAANFRQLSVIGNNGDKRRYGRGLWNGVEDTIPATDKEIELYRALMCICPTLPIKQDLVFNDLTSVEENISLMESKVFPNPASRQFTVQGQAFTQISVYDVLGTLIEQSVIDGAGQWKNNPTLYTNGYYTVQLRHGDGRMENLSVIMFQ
ncbi:MAG TPA: T9SS type A sorting domain-containing protein, partial [Candidatus Kapabacteria bacterium]|nr:T9SS type A sorting domain-containing protein [Candidatus Kapabacteria bacterium]